MFPCLEFDRIFWKVLFLVVLILFIGVSQVGENQDEAKIIDVKKVPSCPATKEKWLEDATAKNCSSKIVTFKYHCLLNHWRNQSFVFCGEDKRIIGFYCLEYDETRGEIRENYNIKCIESNPPCPIKYNSSDVYKYPDCIKSNIIHTSNTTTNENIEENIDYIETARYMFIVVVSLISLPLLIIMFLIMVKLINRRRRIRDDVQSNIYEDKYPHSDDVLSTMYTDKYPYSDTVLTRQRPLSNDVQSNIYEDKYPYSDDVLSTMYTDPFLYSDTVLTRQRPLSSRPLSIAYTSFDDFDDCLKMIDDDEYSWSATKLSKLFGYQNPMNYNVKFRSSIKDSSRLGFEGTKVSFSQPVQDIKKLSSFITKEFHQPTSNFSFAKELLCCVSFDDVILEVESLSREVILNKTIETTADNDEHGRVYVAEVTVTCEKNELKVNQKNSNYWEKFLQANQEDPVKVILIHSKSVRVIEAKLKIYREYKNVIVSRNIFLQHVYDDVEGISKLSVHNKLTWLCGAVKTFRTNLNYLNKILENDMDSVLTEDYILELCHPEQSLSDNIFHFKYKTLRETEKFILRTLQSIIEKLGTIITKHVKSQMKMTNLLQLEFKIRRVLIQIFISNLSWQKRRIEKLSYKEIREKVARDISGKKSDILKGILSAIEATDDNLRNISRILHTAIKDLKLINQKEAVKTWGKREALQCLRGPENYSSVLKYIAGQKDNKLAIKVFLSYDDTSAKDFFKHNNQIPKGTCIEFVNVAEKSKEIFEAEKENMDCSSFPDNNNMKTKLGEVINKHAMKLYSKHSSIVGLDAGNMFLEGKMQPCIIIYSLDKDLIPYGEDPLPKTLDGWHCEVREDIVMFGLCFDCRQITYPNPGCCIGLPSNGIGSAGFLAKLKDSESPVTGFLTAAHVAANNWTDLYDFNDFLSNLVASDCRDEIVHPLLPDYTQYQIIGKVRESFCGNWGEEGFGIDAAFVQNSEPRHGEYSELQIADENILQFNVSKVMKRGGSTGETEGLLTGNTLSVCVDKDFNFGGFYYFARCFSIKSISRPFFEKGDSGSGVFLMENGKPTKPLGIAFANLLIYHNTAVCRIDKIAEAFGLSVYQHEEPMEI